MNDATLAQPKETAEDFDSQAMTERLLSLLGEAPNRPQQLLMALTVALLLHVVVILGLQFTRWIQPEKQPAYSLNVTLIQQAGGDLDASLGGLEQTPPPPDPATYQQATEASQRQLLQAQVTSASNPENVIASGALSGTDGFQIDTSEPISEPQPTTDPVEDKATESAPETVATLQGESAEISPRDADSDAHDSSQLEGFYAETWRLSVEQAATQHLPRRVREENLKGRLTIDVAIRSDGSVANITMLRSSGNPTLDRAARQIVFLAAPFEPFPPALRRIRDEIHIIRTWEFDQGSSLRASAR